jgi:hypothetical protein
VVGHEHHDRWRGSHLHGFRQRTERELVDVLTNLLAGNSRYARFGCAKVRLDMASSVKKAKIVELRRIANAKGNLTPIEASRDVPFDIKRVYYLYDVPGGENRGGHAHRALEQFIVAASGSFDVVLDDGHERRTFFLNRSYYGLYVPPMLWRELENFSSGSVCLVLASALYDDADYIRDYTDFASLVRPGA